MYYFINAPRTPAMMPRILREDTGVPELCAPMEPIRRKLRLRMPKRHTRQQEPRCICQKPCTV